MHNLEGDGFEEEQFQSLTQPRGREATTTNTMITCDSTNNCIDEKEVGISNHSENDMLVVEMEGSDATGYNYSSSSKSRGLFSKYFNLGTGTRTSNRTLSIGKKSNAGEDLDTSTSLDSNDSYNNSDKYNDNSNSRHHTTEETPRSVQLLRRENLAVPACYLTVGILQGLSGPLINVYPLFLNATEAQQATISSIRGLPATFKLFFGFWSDNYPLFGYRRKSYMSLGWMLSSFSMLCLLLFSNLDRIPVSSTTNSNTTNITKFTAFNQVNVTNITSVHSETSLTYEPSPDAPSIQFLSVMLLIFGIGFWFADVMGDSIVAEKAKFESPSQRGQLQSTCYACRFFGLMITAPISTVLYSSFGPKIVIVLMGLVPLAMLPLIHNLAEERDIQVKGTLHQCEEIWNTVCSRAVWQPMGFVYLYNVLQVSNAAWREFLKSILGFEDYELNILLIAAYVLLYLGIMAYKYYFIKWSWRSVYIFTTLINGFLSALQVLLIQGITFGLSPFIFALGDDAFADFIAGIQFLPTTIMMVHLCPKGSEGASYAMFTTVNNSAMNVASALSTVMLGIWDVSKETMLSGDLSGMTKLTILTTVFQISGVLFVKLLPNTKEDLTKLHADSYSGSRIGGFIFLTITCLSIIYALVVGVLNIVAPGWAGES